MAKGAEIAEVKAVTETSTKKGSNVTNFQNVRIRIFGVDGCL